MPIHSAAANSGAPKRATKPANERSGKEADVNLRQGREGIGIAGQAEADAHARENEAVENAGPA